MIQVKNKNVIIPLDTWNELKQIDYFKELIEVLEDSKAFEKAKNDTTSFMDLDKYMTQRENSERKKGNTGNRRINKKRKSYV
jgi:hypothetical protein